MGINIIGAEPPSAAATASERPPCRLINANLDIICSSILKPQQRFKQWEHFPQALLTHAYYFSIAFYPITFLHIVPAVTGNSPLSSLSPPHLLHRQISFFYLFFPNHLVSCSLSFYPTLYPFITLCIIIYTTFYMLSVISLSLNTEVADHDFCHRSVLLYHLSYFELTYYISGTSPCSFSMWSLHSLRHKQRHHFDMVALKCKTRKQNENATTKNKLPIKKEETTTM